VQLNREQKLFSLENAAVCSLRVLQYCTFSFLLHHYLFEFFPLITGGVLFDNIWGDTLKLITYNSSSNIESIHSVQNIIMLVTSRPLESNRGKIMIPAITSNVTLGQLLNFSHTVVIHQIMEHSGNNKCFT
jgi:hypothetical protein